MKKVLCLLSSVILILMACSHDDSGIKLSRQSFEFNAQGDSAIVNVDNVWRWWVNSVSVNDTVYIFPDEVTEPDRYSIAQDCFVIKRLDKRTLFIKVDENPFNTERILSIYISGGDYEDYVVIAQKPK